MKTFNVEFSYGRIGQNQMGWVCRWWFKVETVQQFTEETHQAFASSAWWFLAWWRARREAKKLHARLAASREEREALGWGGGQ